MCMLAPCKLPVTEPANSVGSLYLISNTEEYLSPYLASNPPAENSISETMSELIKLNPSCCPDLTRNGR